VTFFKVKDHSVHFTWELYELTRHCILKTVNAGNPVTYRKNASCFTYFNLFVVLIDLFFEDAILSVGTRYSKNTIRTQWGMPAPPKRRANPLRTDSSLPHIDHCEAMLPQGSYAQ
jgi:hypothetical protein